MKNFLFFLVLLVSSSASADSLFTGTSKYVQKPGSGGLIAAQRECAEFVGTYQWQSCVAYHDGAYTLSADGSIRRNLVREENAPAPTKDGSVDVAKVYGYVENGKVVWRTTFGR